jgi:hypothetical protein
MKVPRKVMCMLIILILATVSQNMYALNHCAEEPYAYAYVLCVYMHTHTIYILYVYTHTIYIYSVYIYLLQ